MFQRKGCTCPLSEACRLKNGLSDALDAFYTTLDKINLRDLVAGNTRLGQVLAVA
jgi:Rrf2 family transcriptional regulator, nitric oxide-sensitive transcriptional repressor